MITVNIMKNGSQSKTYTAPAGNVQGSPDGPNMIVDVKLEGAVIEYGTATPKSLLISGKDPFGSVRLHTSNEPRPADPEEEILYWLGPATFGVYRADSERPCACCEKPITKGTKAIRWMNPGRPHGNQREASHAHCLTNARLHSGAYPSILKMITGLQKTKERVRQDEAVEALVRGGMDRAQAKAATCYDHLTDKEPRAIAEALGEIITPRVGDLVGIMDYRLSMGPVKVGVISGLAFKAEVAVQIEGRQEKIQKILLRLIQRDGKNFNFQEYAE